MRLYCVKLWCEMFKIQKFYVYDGYSDGKILWQQQGPYHIRLSLPGLYMRVCSPGSEIVQILRIIYCFPPQLNPDSQ